MRNLHTLFVVLFMTVLTQLFALPTDTLSIYSNGVVISRIPVNTIDSMNFNPVLEKITHDEFFNGPTTALNNLVNWNLMGTNAHDSFGLMAILHATDLMSEDIVMSKLSHFRYDYGHANINFNFRRPRMIWTYFFDVIKISNKIIESVPSNSDNHDIKFNLGQAFALRGFAYLYLVQLFQHTAYESVLANLFLPTVPLIYAAKEGKHSKTYRVPAHEILAQIEEDLLRAKQQLNGLRRPSKNYINTNVVCGLLARYYLLTGQWTYAIDAAREARQGYDVMPSHAIMDGFMHINNAEWMWGFDHNSETTSIYASFFSHISNLTGGYAGLEYAPRLIDKRLYEYIPATDARKGWFQDAAGSIVVTTNVSASATGWKLPYANLKFGWATGFTQDYMYMRASEMVLIEAEALAHQAGKGGEAATALMQLMSKRNPSWSQSSVTVEDVWMQRRIELWGEGFAYFDLKRFNLGIDRTGENSNHESGNKFVVPAGDKRWNFELPDIAFEEFPDLSTPNLLPAFNPISIINMTGTTMSYSSTIQNLPEQVNYIKGLMYTTDPKFKIGIVSVNSINYANGHVDTIRGLIPETTYFCKLYYKSAKGNVYSEVVTFNTIAAILTQVTHTVTKISETNIQVTGSYQFTSSIPVPIFEKGFDIALDSTFTAGRIRKTIENNFEVTFDNLKKGNGYYVRAFAKTIDGYAFSPATKAIIAANELPFNFSSTDSFNKWQEIGLLFIDADGDNRNWELSYLNGSQAEVGLKSYSWNNIRITPENYVILPAIKLGTAGAKIVIDVQAYDETYFQEKFKIIISTNPISNVASARSATAIYTEKLSTATRTTKTIDIPASYLNQVVWIGICHFECVDQYAIGVTNIKVY